MDYFKTILLALMQGITEFLPISSSAHLILLPQVAGWKDQGIIFDVAVHLGTLLAVIWYFREDISDVASNWLRSMFGKPHVAEDARLGSCLIIGSVPLVLVGLAAEEFVASELRSAGVIAMATAVFGVALWLADLRSRRIEDEHKLRYSRAALIGLAQVLALIPGTSRSGITITAGLALGLSREAASRFSFLLAVPAIAGASVFESFEMLESPAPIRWARLLTGLVVAAISAYFCIRVFLAVIGRIGMLPFMLYRLLLAGAIYIFLV